MTDLHILSDQNTKFWKLKKGIKNICLEKKFTRGKCLIISNKINFILKSEILHGGQLAQVMFFTHAPCAQWVMRGG